MAQFTNQEAEAVLLEAARRESHAATGQVAVSRERLEAMAAELDISPETLAAVIAERDTKANIAAERQTFIRERRGTILPHVVPYLSLCAFLFVIWAITGGGHPWFVYPAFGWGIGVVSHIAAVYPAGGAAFEAAFAEHLKKSERRERDRQKREAKRLEKEAAKMPTVAATKEPDTWQPSAEVAPNVQKVGRKG